MRIAYFLNICIAGLLLTACSHIADDERLIYVKPAPTVRSVLLEDFTGQRCINCPKASEEISALQQQYGEDAIIAVGIHAGPLAMHPDSRFVGLATDTGDEYFDHWHLEYQPVGLIDRSTPMKYSEWSAKIHEELQKPAPVAIALDPLGSTASDSLSIHVMVTATDGNISGKLQVWIVEDRINAFQMMPDGTINDDYIHRHVFRTAVNGTWGDDVSISEGYVFEHDYKVALSADWKRENLSVIVFVYDASGVLQVSKKNL